MWCKVAQGFWFQQHVADWHYALPRHKYINIVNIPAASVKHTILFQTPWESLHLGESLLFFLSEKKIKSSTWGLGKRCFFLVGFLFFSWNWIGILWATRQRILVLLYNSYSSGACLQFASTSEYLLACELSLLWMRFSWILVLCKCSRRWQACCR